MIVRHRGQAVAATLALALLVGLTGCGSEGTSSGSSAERAKAAELQAKLEPLDLDIETDTAISLYGDDGGKLCEVAADPTAMEREGLLAHPRFALRHLEVSKDAVAYTKAVIEVYCPDELGAVTDYIEGLRVDDGS